MSKALLPRVGEPLLRDDDGKPERMSLEEMTYWLMDLRLICKGRDNRNKAVTLTLTRDDGDRLDQIADALVYFEAQRQKQANRR